MKPIVHVDYLLFDRVLFLKCFHFYGARHSLGAIHPYHAGSNELSKIKDRLKFDMLRLNDGDNLTGCLFRSGDHEANFYDLKDFGGWLILFDIEKENLFQILSTSLLFFDLFDGNFAK